MGKGRSLASFGWYLPLVKLAARPLVILVIQKKMTGTFISYCRSAISRNGSQRMSAIVPPRFSVNSVKA